MIISHSGHPRIDQLAQSIGSLPGVDRVWLYGSRARGDAFKHSDYDLAVDAPHLKPDTWHIITGRVEEAPILYDIDCVHLQKVPDALRESILTEGKVLYAYD